VPSGKDSDDSILVFLFTVLIVVFYSVISFEKHGVGIKFNKEKNILSVRISTVWTVVPVHCRSSGGSPWKCRVM
jgi:hypothetical protein